MSAPPTTVPLAALFVVWLASILGMVILAFPMAFLLMLFLGNLGVHLGFLACIPGAMVLSSVRLSTNNTNTTRSTSSWER